MSVIDLFIKREGGSSSTGINAGNVFLYGRQVISSRTKLVLISQRHYKNQEY